MMKSIAVGIFLILIIGTDCGSAETGRFGMLISVITCSFHSKNKLINRSLDSPWGAKEQWRGFESTLVL